MSFQEFFGQMMDKPILLVTVLLTLGVIFVNGWTDAPNAIATCISTRSISPRAAILMAAVFNFLGVLGMSLVAPLVANTIKGMVNFGGNTEDALVALCAALLSIVVWAVAAWYFGIPTSESHALIAGISGAAVALQGGFSGIIGEKWMMVLVGLVLSTLLGFFSGYGTNKLVEFLARKKDRRKTEPFFRNAQVFGGAAMAFMHGAQDGLKFIGVLMLSTFLAKGEDPSGEMPIAFWMIVLCSVLMAVGTSVGGYRIIKAVGMDMVKLEKHQGFSADLSASACLLLASLTGIPVSTTHTKTTAMMGVGATRRLSAVNWGVVKDMGLAWVLTFPGCGIIGYLTARIFINIF